MEYGWKGLTLGTANCAKVIVRTSMRPPRATHGGTRGLITVTECCGARQKILAAMFVCDSTLRILPTIVVGVMNLGKASYALAHSDFATEPKTG